MRDTTEHNLEGALKRIFGYMSCHRIFDAARVARKLSLHRLSLLIPQINTNRITRYILTDQIHNWNVSGEIDEIDADMIKIYMVLAGCPVNRDVNICEGLSWQKAVALHLWYLTSSTQSLNEAVSMYEQSFKSHVGYSNHPTPPYPGAENYLHYDIEFHLMKLYANNTNSLEEILNTFTHTPDATDYRLSWFLLHMFSAFKIGRISENAKNHMHINFAFQLENLGLYKWAIYVLLFIQDARVKTQLVTGVLERNLPTDVNRTEVEFELVKYFKIPKRFLHKIKAEKASAAFEYWSTFRHLTFTRDWNRCHDLLIKHIIPTLYLNEYYDIIEEMLSILEPKSDQIIDWNVHGSVYLDFVKVRDKLIVNRDVDDVQKASKLYSDICNLLNRVTYYRPKTPIETVCVSEISKHTLIFMKTMQLLLNFDFAKMFGSYNTKIEDLDMPPDYRIEDLLDTINKFYPFSSC